MFDRTSFSKPATLQEVRHSRRPSAPPGATLSVGARRRRPSPFFFSFVCTPAPLNHPIPPPPPTPPHQPSRQRRLRKQATGRLRKNLAYFRVNYAAATAATVALAFVSHPSSLMVLAALSLAWVYVFALHQGPVVVNGRSLSEREKLLAMSAASFVLVFFLTGVGSLAFSALVAAGALVAAHGAARAPDDLFLDEGGDGPGAQGGLLSILMGGGGGGGGSGGAGNV